ncbi:retrovirus-related pol polyprotein from transposon TNT 1-94 [Tanacetum coccineum]
MIEKMTPMKMWSGHPRDYGKLRIFCHLTYSHVKQGKLEAKAVKCVLLGYHEGVKWILVHVLINLMRNYWLRLKRPRIRRKPLGFQVRGIWMAAYAFAAIEEEDTHEPLIYQEAVACEDGSKWKAVMKEEIDSLRKKKTWETYAPGARGSKEDSWYGDRQGSDSQDYEGVIIRIPLGEHFKLSLKDCPFRDCDVERMSFVDSDYAKDLDEEAEYMALTEVVKESIWIRGLLEELGVELNTVTVNCDNQGAIYLSRNHVFHQRTKHINVGYHLSERSWKQRQLKF